MKIFTKLATTVLFCTVFLLFGGTTSAQWELVNGPFGGYIYSLAAGGNKIFAGTNHGIFLSRDYGQSWKAVSNGLTDLEVQALAICGNRIFAGTYTAGVFMSEDEGINWKKCKIGFINPNVISLNVSGSYIFAGTDGKGIFISADSGITWNNVLDRSPYFRVISLAASGQNIYAGSEHNGIYYSPDYGKNWVSASNGLGDFTIISLAAKDSYIFAGTQFHGIYVSTDHGKNWKQINSGLPANRFVYELTISGNSIFAGTCYGIFISSDNGNNWTKASSGLPDHCVLSMAAIGTSVLVGNYYGLFRSNNNGLSWTEADSGITSYEITKVAVSGKNMFLCTDKSDLMISNDEGKNWFWVDTNLPYAPNSVAVCGATVFAGTDHGLYCSDLYGRKWTEAGKRVSGVEIISLSVSGKNIAAGTEWDGVFLSTDSGKSWKATDKILRHFRRTQIPGITISLSKLKIVSTDYLRIYISKKGNHWKKTGENIILDDFSLTTALCGNNIFIGSWKGIYLSQDNGKSWIPANKGLADSNIRTLAVQDSVIFAGTGSGIYLSDNNGNSWIPAGLTGLNITSLHITETDIYAGTFGQGFWKCPLSRLLNKE